MFNCMNQECINSFEMELRKKVSFLCIWHGTMIQGNQTFSPNTMKHWANLRDKTKEISKSVWKVLYFYFSENCVVKQDTFMDGY